MLLYFLAFLCITMFPFGSGVRLNPNIRHASRKNALKNDITFLLAYWFFHVKHVGFYAQKFVIIYRVRQTVQAKHFSGTIAQGASTAKAFATARAMLRNL